MVVRYADELRYGSGIAGWHQGIDVHRLRTVRAAKARAGAALIDRWPREEVLVAPRA